MPGAELRAVSLFNDKGPVASWLDHLLVVGQSALLLAQGAPEEAIEHDAAHRWM